MNSLQVLLLAALAALATSDGSLPKDKKEGKSLVQEADKIDTKEKYYKNIYTFADLARDQDVLVEKIKDEYYSDGVYDVTNDLINNFMTYFRETRNLLERVIPDYGRSLEGFLKAIPKSHYKTLALLWLKTAHEHANDYCGELDLKYNPVHPGLDSLLRSRTRRETSDEFTNFNEAGKTWSKWLTKVDNHVTQYIMQFAYKHCTGIQNWLEEIIIAVEKMTPDEFVYALVSSIWNGDLFGDIALVYPFKQIIFVLREMVRFFR